MYIILFNTIFYVYSKLSLTYISYSILKFVVIYFGFNCLFYLKATIQDCAAAVTSVLKKVRYFYTLFSIINIYHRI